jgi:predicted NBD/HSP70 family sugar kinase
VAGPSSIAETLRATHEEMLFPPGVPRSTRSDGDRLARTIACANQGDSACQAAVENAGQRLGLAIANLCSVFNPQCVIVGGILRDAGELILQPIREQIQRHSLRAAGADVNVLVGSLGHHAGIIGALAFVIRDERFSPRLLDILEYQALSAH